MASLFCVSVKAETAEISLNLTAENEYIIESHEGMYSLEDLMISGESEKIQIEILESTNKISYDSQYESFNSLGFTGERSSGDLTELLHTFELVAEDEYRVSAEYNNEIKYLNADKNTLYSSNQSTTVNFLRINNGDFALCKRTESALYKYICLWFKGGLYWDQFSNCPEWSEITNTSIRNSTIMHLFRPAEDDLEYENSMDKIPGYVEVSEIEDGKQYLIASIYNGAYYVMKPGATYANYIGRLIPDSFFSKENPYTRIKISGLEETLENIALTVGSQTYNIEVISRYDRAPFDISMNIDSAKTSFGSGGFTQGIVTKANGRDATIGSDYLPKVTYIDWQALSYTLEKPANYDEISGNYVFTKVMSGADNDARSAAIRSNSAKGGGLNADNYVCPGAEFEFAGYSAVNSLNNEVILPAGTVLNWRKKELKAILPSGEEMELIFGQTLKALWTYRSSLASFVVDFQGTILDSDGDIARRTGSSYTWPITVAQIYGGQNEGSSNVMSKEVNRNISMFYSVPSYNPSNNRTQIIMELYAYIPGANMDKIWIDSKGNTVNNMTAEMLSYIRNSRPDIAVSISSDGSKKVPLNKADIDISNYDVRWYSIEEAQSSIVHVNGVLVALTGNIAVSSLFDGVDEDELGTILENYRINVNINNNTFISMDKNGTNEAVYTYNGSSEKGAYNWSYKAMKGSQHTFTESGYELNGYDCIKTMMADSVIVDPNAALSVADSSSVVFYNCYTKTDTGMFLLSNTAEDNDFELAGSVFELSKDGDLKEMKTNSKGMLLFNNLSPGIYTLKQKSVQEGYALNEDVYEIEVSSDGNTIVKVVKDNSIIYDRENGILVPLLIKNRSNKETLNIIKKFGGDISAKQVEELFEHGYRITISQGDDVYTLGKDNALSFSPDGLTYYWTLTGIKTGEYQFREDNLNAGFVSTYAEISVEELLNARITESDIRNVPDYASFTFIPDDSGLSSITSKTIYDKEKIGLEILKTNKENVPLSGAKFYVYTSVFNDWKKDSIPQDASSTVQYLNKDGSYSTAYYLTETDLSDDKGYILVNKLRYELADYVLVEAKAPNGYSLDLEPTVIYCAQDNDEYYNGRLHARVINTPTVFRLYKYSDFNRNILLNDAVHEIKEVIGFDHTGAAILDEADHSCVVKDNAYVYDTLLSNKLYALKEIEAPDDYLRDEQLHYFCLKDDSSDDYDLYQEFIKGKDLEIIDLDGKKSSDLYLPEHLDNRLTLTVQVIDGDRDDEPIAGIGFTLYQEVEKGTSGSKTIKTTAGEKTVVAISEQKISRKDENNQSIVSFDGLIGEAENKYYLLQTKNVIGYLSSDTAIEVYADINQLDDGNINVIASIKGIEKLVEDRNIKITIKNYSKLDMPVSGSNFTSLNILLLGLCVIAFSLLLLLKLTGSLHIKN